jgi:hypothetical protein
MEVVFDLFGFLNGKDVFLIMRPDFHLVHPRSTLVPLGGG